MDEQGKEVLLEEVPTETKEPVPTPRSRWRSWVLWSGIGAQVLSILVAFDVIDVGQSEILNLAIAGILQAFAAFGIINNPTSKHTL